MDPPDLTLTAHAWEVVLETNPELEELVARRNDQGRVFVPWASIDVQDRHDLMARLVQVTARGYSRTVRTEVADQVRKLTHHLIDHATPTPGGASS